MMRLQMWHKVGVPYACVLAKGGVHEGRVMV